MYFKNTKPYKKGYASDIIRGIDSDRPWNLINEIKKLLNPSDVLLDIGSGDARKIIPLTNFVKRLIALEPSTEMRSLAASLIELHKVPNIQVIDGVAANLPFPDESIDIVTCNLAPWNNEQIFRVLKPGGCFINETIGCTDKIKFKKFFGKDKYNQWRGQLINFEHEDFINNFIKEYEKYFVSIDIKNGFWDTYYTKEGLLELCKQTPTIKDFDLNKDNKNFEDAIANLKTDNGIKIQQNRLIIKAFKPKN